MYKYKNGTFVWWNFTEYKDTKTALLKVRVTE